MDHTQRRKRGRPKLPDDEVLSAPMRLRLSQQAFAQCYDAATLDGRALAPWARSVLEAEAKRRLDEQKDGEQPEGAARRPERNDKD